MTESAPFTPEVDLADLESAEDFLEYFGIQYDRSVVQVNRLHILQRFHNYVKSAQGQGEIGHATYRGLLEKAYEDFVHSDARTEKVMRVYQRQQGHTVTIPVSSIGRAS